MLILTRHQVLFSYRCYLYACQEASLHDVIRGDVTYHDRKMLLGVSVGRFVDPDTDEGAC